MTEQTKRDEISTMHWAQGLGSGLLAGAAVVAVAMLIEHEVVKVGLRRFWSR